MNNLSHCVLVVEKKFKLIYVNDFFLKISGYKSEEILGERIDTFIKDINFSLVTSKEVSQILSVKCKNGDIFSCYSYIYPIVNKKYFILVFFISNTNSDSNIISKEKIKLLEIVHDINNMLAVAFGVLSVMKDNEEISILRESLSAIQGMIIDFNCFLNNQKTEQCFFSIIEVIQLSIKLACSHRPFIEYSIINNASYYYLTGNQTDILRAFYNLFHNSCEAMKNKGKIEIYVENVVEDNLNNPLFLQIKIKDNGPGIKEEDIEKIFEPFISSKGKGRGLGLHIVKNIIENLNGTIFLESKKESSSGTTFIIRLPIQKTEIR